MDADFVALSVNLVDEQPTDLLTAHVRITVEGEDPVYNAAP